MRPFIVQLLVLTLVGSAHAQPLPISEGATQDVIQQGIQLRRAGKDEAALALFLDLERRTPDSVRVLLHVTAAAQAIGKWLMAHEYLEKAEAYKADSYYQRHRVEIQQMTEAVAQRVGQLRVIGSPVGAEVRVNGEAIGTLPMTETRAVEVGSYQLEVSKPGYYSLRRPLSIVAGSPLTQEAVELKPGVALAQQVAPPGASRQSAAAEEGRPQAWRARWVTWTLGGATIAAATTAGIAFAVREGKTGHWNDESRCLDASNPGLTREEVCGDVLRSAHTAERVGIVGGSLALGFGAATVAHFLASSAGSSGSAQTKFRANFGPGVAFVQCGGAF